MCQKCMYTSMHSPRLNSFAKVMLDIKMFTIGPTSQNLWENWNADGYSISDLTQHFPVCDTSRVSYCSVLGVCGFLVSYEGGCAQLGSFAVLASEPSASRMSTPKQRNYYSSTRFFQTFVKQYSSMNSCTDLPCCLCVHADGRPLFQGRTLFILRYSHHARFIDFHGCGGRGPHHTCCHSRSHPSRCVSEECIMSGVVSVIR